MYRDLVLRGIRAFFTHDGRLFTFDDGAVDRNGLDVVASWDFIHDIEHDFLEDGAQGAGSCASLQGFLGKRLESVLGDLEFDAIHGNQLGILLDQCVFGLSEDLDQLFGGEFAQ